MSVCVTADKNATSEFMVPVTWQVFDKVCVQAASLQEAIDYVKLNADEIPLGSDPSYVSESYEIAEESIDDMLIYQPANEMLCLDFWCNKNMNQFTDSMLFDSFQETGEVIASGTFRKGGKELKIRLVVNGEVSVKFKEEVYRNPSEFPEELYRHIKENPNQWAYCELSEEEPDGSDNGIYVYNNNWFEYLLYPDGEGVVYEEDLAVATEKDILQDMTEIAKFYFSM